MKYLQHFKPTLSQSWLIALFLIVGSLALGLIVNALGLLLGFSWKCESLSYLLGMLFPFAYILFKSIQSAGSGPVPLNRFDFGRMGAGLYFPVAVVGMLSLSVLIEPASALMPMPDFVKSVFEEAFLNVSLWDGIVSTCILAPLCEEFLCRGMMLRGMLHQGHSPRSAILWSALIFAVMHLNPWQAVPAFIIGLFFGWIYYRTGSLWTTIALHCVNNSLSTFLMRSLDGMDVDDGFIDILPTGRYVILYCICLVVFTTVILILRKNEKTLSA